jgi:hypothetical protein
MVGDGIGDEGGDGQSSAESVSGSSGMRGKPVPLRCVTGTAWPEKNILPSESAILCRD